jgi:hypothetical protein
MRFITRARDLTSVTTRLLTLAWLAAGAAACPSPKAEPAGDAAAATSGSTGATTNPSVPANGLPLPSASVAAAVNPAGLPAYSGPTGSVEGTITISGDEPPVIPNQDFSACPAAAPVYDKLFRIGAAMTLDGGVAAHALPDAIVAVTGYSGYFIPERNEAKHVAFEGCGFPTRTITLTFGQRLEITNATSLLFAPELAQAPTPAALIVPPNGNGDPVRIYPPHPGWFTLVDKVRSLPYLREDVFAFMHPLHTVSDANGHYRIDGVPVGTLDINTRLQPISREITQKVTIVENVVTRVDLNLVYTAPTDAGAPVDAGKDPRLRIH